MILYLCPLRAKYVDLSDILSTKAQARMLPRQQCSLVQMLIVGEGGRALPPPPRFPPLVRSRDLQSGRVVNEKTSYAAI